MAVHDEESFDGSTVLTRSPAENLLRKMAVTSGCRFNAAKRLEERDGNLTRLTAFASAYVIVLTVLPYFMHLQQSISDWLNLFTVGCAIVILISSLLQNASGNAVNAEQHHRSGLEISDVWRDLDITKHDVSDDDLKTFSSRYNAILHKYSVNHDDIDFAKYRLERPEFYGVIKGWDNLRIRCQLLYTKYLPSISLTLMTLIIIILLLNYAMPFPDSQ